MHSCATGCLGEVDGQDIFDAVVSQVENIEDIKVNKRGINIPWGSLLLCIVIIAGCGSLYQKINNDVENGEKRSARIEADSRWPRDLPTGSSPKRVGSGYAGAAIVSQGQSGGSASALPGAQLSDPAAVRC